MAERAYGNKNIALLRNVVAFTTLVETVVERPQGLPKIGLFYGWSGFGKSTAATYAANLHRAHVIEMRSAWGRGYLVEQIAHELGLEPKPRSRIADIVERVGESLKRSQRPLFIDEADYLVNSNMVELIRDIYELSGGAIVLIGEEQLPHKLERFERFHGRMVPPVAAEPAMIEDVGYLAPIYCDGVEIADDLAQALFEASRHSVRRITENLTAVQQLGRRLGLDRVTLADWGDEPFSNGSTPGARRGLKP